MMPIEDRLSSEGDLQFAGLVVTSKTSLTLRLAGGNSTFDLNLNGVHDSEVGLEGLSNKGSVRIYSEHPYLWNYGPWSTIFGNAPLPDVPKFFYDFNQLVRDTLKVERDPLDYLHFENSISEWRSFVYSRAYTLLSAPTPVAEACCPLLERQAAEFAILPDPNRGGVKEGVQLLTFGTVERTTKIVFESIELQTNS